MGDTGTTVRIEIVDILVGGRCPAGLQAGRSWVVRDSAVPEGMCSWAWNAILPFVTALRFGGAFPWSGERRVRLTCPDADNPVVFLVQVAEEGSGSE